MRSIGLLAALIALASVHPGVAAADGEFTIRPVQCTTLADLPEEARQLQFTNKGTTIGYLVEGHDLIGVDPHSLVLTTFATKDGRSILAKRDGDPNYTAGPFPKASDDGRYASFQLETDESLFGHTDGLNVVGTITVLTGRDLTTQSSKAHRLESKETEHVGNYDITFGDADGSMESGGDPTIQITVKGALNILTAVNVIVDGKRLKRQGWGGSDRARMYSFDKPAGTMGQVELRYWKTVGSVVVPFGK